MKIIDWVDPPEGWKYGFPKQVDDAYHNMGIDKTQWYIDNGYPQRLIDQGMLNYTRVGFKEISNEL